MSSKVIIKHYQDTHSEEKRGSIRQLSKMIPPKEDSVYSNKSFIKPGIVLQSKGIGIVQLKERIDLETWRAVKLINKEDLVLNILEEITSMKVLGTLVEITDSGVHITDVSNQANSFHEFESQQQDFFTPEKQNTEDVFESQQRVFFTSENQYTEDVVFLTTIPRSRHREAKCIEAKRQELENFDTFDVYELVDAPEKIQPIDTEWVLVEKEVEGKTVTKARLCMRGDCEQNRHNIPKESPTVNKITLRIMLALAATKNLNINCADIKRAFLQTEPISRDVYVKPPIEAQIPNNKCWKLKRSVYGLVDASRAFFLRHAKGLKELGF